MSSTLPPHSQSLTISTSEEHQTNRSMPSLTIPLRSSIVARRAREKTHAKTLNVTVPKLHARRASQAPLSALAIDLGVRAPHPLGRQELLGAHSANDSSYSDDKYKAGPICILPNLYLGSEQNASSLEIIKTLGIRFILNVAKEVNNPLFKSSPLKHELVAESPQLVTKPIDSSPKASSTAAVVSSVTKRTRARAESNDLRIRLSPSRASSVSPRSRRRSEVDSPTRIMGGLSLRSTPSPTNPTFGQSIHSISSDATLFPTISRPNSPFPVSPYPTSPVAHRVFVFPPIVTIDTAQEPSMQDEMIYTPTTPRTPTTPGPYLIPFVMPQYRKLNWDHNEEIIPQLENIFQYIDEARRNNQPILINCQQGVSRSATLVIAYAMKTLRLRLSQGYAFVKARSQHICPNMGLMSQLAEFEQKLFTDEKREYDCV
ncbi:hypothetical protein HK096_006906 [Nowakowskiella sp. JEL0078]|nr:hypothetical protein HK096_006906 [Nowakowskiella sp. JEL0078]